MTTDPPFRKAVSLAEAEALAIALAQPVSGEEELPLAAATGRVVARAVVSPLDLPTADLAAMDGHALRARDLAGGGPVTLPLSAAPPIRTGAPLPPGTDRVAMIERVAQLADAIRIDTPPPAGANVRPAGSEVRRGEVVLSPGTLLGPGALLAAATTGAARLTLHRKVRVALFCTGDEIVPPGAALAPGKVWNANRVQLAAALQLPYATLIDRGDVRDDPIAIGAAFDAAAEADLIVTTGGSSIGAADHMARVFAGRGGQFSVTQVAMKPGKPVMIGRLGTAIWIGLPGTPVAAFTCWQLLGAPVLRRLAGLSTPASPRLRGAAGFAATPRPGRTEVVPVRLAPAVGPSVLDALPATATGLAGAEALALLPDTGTPIRPGDLLDYIRL